MDMKTVCGRSTELPFSELNPSQTERRSRTEVRKAGGRPGEAHSDPLQHCRGTCRLQEDVEFTTTGSSSVEEKTQLSAKAISLEALTGIRVLSLLILLVLSERAVLAAEDVWCSQGGQSSPPYLQHEQ